MIIAWSLTVICMGVIFWLSGRTADESSAQSDAVLDWLIKLLGDNNLTTFIVRKTAHCLEFMGLCLLFNISLYTTRKKASPILAVICTSLYAATDEIHQIFIEGRSCEFRDWAIDTASAVFSSLCFMVLFFLIAKIIEKKNNKSIDT